MRRVIFNLALLLLVVVLVASLSAPGATSTRPVTSALSCVQNDERVAWFRAHAVNHERGVGNQV